MCKRCGDLKMIACSQCKGVGSAKNGGPFSFIMLEEISESLGDGRTQKQLMSCFKCKSKGRLPCPNCSKLSWSFRKTNFDLYPLVIITFPYFLRYISSKFHRMFSARGKKIPTTSPILRTANVFKCEQSKWQCYVSQGTCAVLTCRGSEVELVSGRHASC